MVTLSLPGGVGAWGTVSSWVGAVLTGGSLLLGFYILLRDRRKEERAQASRIAVDGLATAQPGNDNLFTIHLRIWNNSDQVIFRPLLRVIGNPDKVGLFDMKTNVLLTGEQAEVNIAPLDADSTFGMRVVFLDNAGIEWAYDFYRRRLVKAHWRDIVVGNLDGRPLVTAVLHERLTPRAWLRRRNGTETVTLR